MRLASSARSGGHLSHRLVVIPPERFGDQRRLRHQLPEPWETESGWSFPSGHVMGSLVAYGFLAYLLTRTHLGGRQGRECLDHCHRRRVPLSDQHLLALVSSDR